MKAITGTLEQIQDYYYGLDGKIQRDSDGIEIFQIIEHGDLATLVYQPLIKKERKQPRRSELAKKASVVGWDIKNVGDGWAIEHDRNGAIMYKTKTLRGIQRKLDNMIYEYYRTEIKSDFLRKYNVIH